MKKNRSMRQFLSLASLCGLGLIAVPVISGCSGGSSGGVSSLAGTSLGTPVSVGNGAARSFVTRDALGRVTDMGLKFNEAALQNLPDHHESYILPLPADGGFGPIDHISFDWEAHGHPPNPIYTNAHFDIHFYMVSQAERANIMPPNGDTPAPAAKYIAQDYVSGVDTVPQMGVHYIDPTAPEFNPPQAFNRTFIYGFYKGQMTFLEPMVAKSYLDSKPNESVAIKQPAAFQKAGAYPTRYSVRYDAASKEYTIALENMVQRAAG